MKRETENLRFKLFVQIGHIAHIFYIYMVGFFFFFLVFGHLNSTYIAVNEI